MSIKIMNRVWTESETGGSELLLLLAIADNADDSGFCWPGTEYLANKIRMSRQSVINITARLEDSGELYVDHNRRRGNRYLVLTDMSADEIASGVGKFKYESKHQNDLCQNLLCQRGFTSDVKDFDNSCKAAALQEPSIPNKEPSNNSESSEIQDDDLFADFEDPEPSGVDWSDPDVRTKRLLDATQAYIAGNGGKPWADWQTERVQPRGGIEKADLQHIGWLVEKVTGYVPRSDHMWGKWRSAYESMYKEAQGDFGTIEAAINSKWPDDPTYRTTKPDKYIEAVGRVVANDDARGLNMSGMF